MITKVCLFVGIALLAGGSALLAEVGFNFVAGNRLYPAALELIIAAVEHFASLRKLQEVTFDDIPHQLLGGSASVLRGEILELSFGFRGEMYIHRP